MNAKDHVSTIISNTCLNDRFYLLKFKNKVLAESANPGNFVMLKPKNITNPILRRPFGIMDLNQKQQSVSIYYETVGITTRYLARMKPKDQLLTLGPLGNSFPTYSGKRILLIAGGRGIAPLFFTLRQLADSNELYLLYGARSSGELNLLDQIQNETLKKSYYYTDDGSYGTRGFITNDLEEIIQNHNIQVTLSCGPEALFAALQDKLSNLNTENYASTEAYMGCGFGICHSCAVDTVSGYKKACSDGPIFKLEELKC